MTASKVLQCVWWDWQGIIHYELLPYGQTLNSDLYCQQLDRLNAALMQKRSSLINRGRIVFHQDNARPHTSLVTRQKLRELGWELLLHPPYSPDLVPSDYHLFLCMANELGSRKLATREAHYEIGISLGTPHRTKRRMFDLNRIIVTNFINN